MPPELNLDAESSATLARRASSGDARALDELCTRYLPRLRRWAHGRLPMWARGALDSQDFAQDALTQVVIHLDTFEVRHANAFQVYVREVLLNRIRDEVRRASRKGVSYELDDDHPDLSPSPLEEAIGSETFRRYEAALARLRPADREAIVLRIELRHDYPTVAAALGKPSVAAAHVAVSRALTRLAREMAHDA